MKIIHCADLHLDSKMESKLSKEQAKERRYEILNTFENMVEYGKSQGVRAIIMVGDVFDTPQNQQRTIKNRVIDVIEREQGIDFHYLQGNHDRDDFFKSDEKFPSNLKLYGEDWKGYKYGNVVLSGMEFTETNQENYCDRLRLSPENMNIVMLHGQTTPYGSGGKETIPLSQLTNKGIDYLALGHVHQYTKQPLDQRGVYCYSGCLEGRGFDECGEKGFVILDVTERGITTEFISVSKRTFHEIKIDATHAENFQEVLTMVHEELEEISSDDLVSLKLVGGLEEDFELDISYLEQLVVRRFYYGQVKNQTELKIVPEKYRNDKTLKGQFIRTVQSLKVSDEEKKKIMQLGLRAIAGKEV